MKSGTSDPFADDETDESSDNQPSENDESDNPVSNTSQSDSTGGPDSTSGSSGDVERADVPYKLRREKVKDDRDDVHQLFVLKDTDAEEQTARRELKDRFEEDVYKLDIREAIYLAGMQNLDDAEDVLQEWGYDF